MNKIVSFIIFLLLITSCSVVKKTTSFCCPSDLDFSDGEIKILENRANEGDSEASMRLSHHFALCERDQEQEEIWLRKAALLRHPEAERWLGYLIEINKMSYTGFGNDKEEALFSLFSDACTSNNKQACLELAKLYETSSTKSNSEKARFFIKKCANLGERLCWDKLGEYYFNGIGGNKSYQEAYFWISLEALCVHPDSINGKKIWLFREQISNEISDYSDFLSLWALLDKYIESIETRRFDIYSSRCGGTTVKNEVYNDCINKISEKDLIHRAEIKHRFAKVNK
jgi:hypothetical protein